MRSHGSGGNKIDGFLSKIDKDTNGEVTPAELKAARELMREHMQQLSATDLWSKIFNHLDKDGDGKISQ